MIAEVLPSELRRTGIDALLVDSLHSLLYAHEAEIIEALLSVMLVLLPIVEPHPERKDAPTYDKLVSRALSAMHYESKVAQRIAYSKHLPGLIASMGIRARTLPCFLKLFSSFLFKSRWW